MARRMLAAMVAGAWLVGSPAAAQVTMRDAPTPGITIQRSDPPRPDPPPMRPDVPPRPPDPQMQPPHDPNADVFRAGPLTYVPRYDKFGRPIPYFGFGYGGGGGYSPVRERRGIVQPSRAVQPPPGYLRLQIQPRDGQVYIDGFYVGTADDLGASRYPLEPGPHRIEIRADGFESVTFDVRIRPYETLTFTKELARIQAAQPAPVAAVARAAAAKTLYVIPRCYAGDRPPAPSTLPAGCSVSALRTIAPATP